MINFINFETSKKLKELGFDDDCIAFYHKDIQEKYPQFVDDDYQYNTSGKRTCYNGEIPDDYVATPTYDQVIDWLEDKQGLGLEIYLDITLSWNWKITPLHPEAKIQKQVFSKNVTMGRKESLKNAILTIIDYLWEN